MLSRFGLAFSIAGGIILLAYFHGGYAPATWGWAAVVGLGAVILGLLLQPTHIVPRAALVMLGALTAFVAWTTVSATWSLSPPRTMLEVERDLIYVALLAAVLLLARSAPPTVLLSGVATGLVILSAYSLVGYFVAQPNFDATQGYLLFHPVGYANALGGLVALALPLVLAFAAFGTRRLSRAVSGASSVVLFAALYLTQNRSGWLALAVALVVWLLRTNAPSKAAGVTLLLGGLAALCLALVAGLGLLDTHASADELSARRLEAAAIVLAVAALAAALTLSVRSLPVSSHAAVRGAQALGLLTAAVITISLFDLGDRAAYWHVAWRAFKQHPLVGTGAGTFDEQWLRLRDIDRSVRDAHNLYLETLSELGVVGFVLLAAILVLPIVFSRRVRDPLLTAGLASYCAFLVHAGFEWDWEMPVVTISGLVIGSILVLSDIPQRAVQLTVGTRLAGAAVAALAAAFSVIALAGNNYLVEAVHRVTRGDVQSAAARANRAATLLPWASEPWLVIGDAHLQRGEPGRARTAYRKAIARDRADWNLWLRLAAVSSGPQREAALQHAITLNPRLLAKVTGKP
jgi:hypothetical protein